MTNLHPEFIKAVTNIFAETAGALPVDSPLIRYARPLDSRYIRFDGCEIRLEESDARWRVFEAGGQPREGRYREPRDAMFALDGFDAFDYASSEGRNFVVCGPDEHDISSGRTSVAYVKGRTSSARLHIQSVDGQWMMRGAIFSSVEACIENADQPHLGVPLGWASAGAGHHYRRSDGATAQRVIIEATGEEFWRCHAAQGSIDVRGGAGPFDALSQVDAAFPLLPDGWERHDDDDSYSRRGGISARHGGGLWVVEKDDHGAAGFTLTFLERDSLAAMRRVDLFDPLPGRPEGVHIENAAAFAAGARAYAAAVRSAIEDDARTNEELNHKGAVVALRSLAVRLFDHRDPLQMINSETRRGEENQL